jgi:hypothetical protein
LWFLTFPFRIKKDYEENILETSGPFGNKAQLSRRPIEDLYMTFWIWRDFLDEEDLSVYRILSLGRKRTLSACASKTNLSIPRFYILYVYKLATVVTIHELRTAYIRTRSTI